MARIQNPAADPPKAAYFAFARFALVNQVMVLSMLSLACLALGAWGERACSASAYWRTGNLWLPGRGRRPSPWAPAKLRERA